MHEDNLDNLGRAVQALRQATAAESLSPPTRSAILRRVRERETVGSRLATLFPTPWRMGLAGALPLALALLVVGLAGRTDPGRAGDPVAHKVNGKVVFEVAAGATVTKSTVPYRFDERGAVEVRNGRYADGIGSGPRLVFYRIEQ